MSKQHHYADSASSIAGNLIISTFCDYMSSVFGHAITFLDDPALKAESRIITRDMPSGSLEGLCRPGMPAYYKNSRKGRSLPAPGETARSPRRRGVPALAVRRVDGTRLLADLGTHATHRPGTGLDTLLAYRRRRPSRNSNGCWRERRATIRSGGRRHTAVARADRPRHRQTTRNCAAAPP